MKGSKEKDYYELLNVARTASKEEIKNAYRELALIYHPDSQFFSEVISEPATSQDIDLFKLITAAYNTLINPELRSEYDATLPPVMRSWDDNGDPCQEALNEKLVKRRIEDQEARATFSKFGRIVPPVSEEPMTENEVTSEAAENDTVWNQIRSIFGRVKV